MKRITIYMAIILPCLVACLRDKGHKHVARAGWVEISSSVTRVFSNMATPDELKLMLKGDSILNSEVTFEILNSDKRRIFIDSFPAIDLFRDLDVNAYSRKRKEDTIKNRVIRFFTDNHFQYPAYKAKDSVYIDYNDTTNVAALEEIRADSTAMAFVYTHGYEGTYFIAYSKKQKKVVTFLSGD